MTSQNKIKEIFNVLFDSIVDVLKEKESILFDEEEKQKTNITKLKNIKFNPFAKVCYEKEDIKVKKAYEKLYYFIKNLEFEESTITIAFIYLDRFIITNKELLEYDSLEM